MKAITLVFNGMLKVFHNSLSCSKREHLTSILVLVARFLKNNLTLSSAPNCKKGHIWPFLLGFFLKPRKKRFRTYNFQNLISHVVALDELRNFAPRSISIGAIDLELRLLA